jgi:hypothetical protein
VTGRCVTWSKPPILAAQVRLGSESEERIRADLRPLTDGQQMLMQALEMTRGPRRLRRAQTYRLQGSR